LRQIGFSEALLLDAAVGLQFPRAPRVPPSRSLFGRRLLLHSQPQGERRVNAMSNIAW
jgi:hypothetical protein